MVQQPFLVSETKSGTRQKRGKNEVRTATSIRKLERCIVGECFPLNSPKQSGGFDFPLMSEGEFFFLLQWLFPFHLKELATAIISPTSTLVVI